MFESHAVARVRSQLDEVGHFEWSYVVNSSDSPWFQVTWSYRSRRGGAVGHSEQRLICSVPLLMEHVKVEDPNHFVSEILLVSPPSMNKTGKYQMEPLNRIISYKMKEGSDDVGYAYEVVGGRAYIGISFRKLKEIQIIFNREILKV